LNNDSMGYLYIGQVDAYPDWTFWSTVEECPVEGHQVEFELSNVKGLKRGECPTCGIQTHKFDKQTALTIEGSVLDGQCLQCPPPPQQQTPLLKLRTERHVVPQRVAGRLPETIMPFSTQLLASEEQKRMAFTSFASSNATRYSGYTTKPNAPVYLLDATAYPLKQMEDDNAWNTFHYLPPPLVPQGDNGIVETPSTAVSSVDIPLEISFFNNILGSQLLVGNNTRVPTSQALHNVRLVGLYFSAHWCGPCRQFTPMLSEMYSHLKDAYPTHGLDIVFVSSDRDQTSFQQYYGSMPWLAIPFETVKVLKQQLSMT
jgi:thiol-disulfide isomerase/thioredoxin